MSRGRKTHNEPKDRPQEEDVTYVRLHACTFKVAKIGRQVKVSFMRSGRVYSSTGKTREEALQIAVETLASVRRKFKPQD